MPADKQAAAPSKKGASSDMPWRVRIDRRSSDVEEQHHRANQQGNDSDGNGSEEAEYSRAHRHRG